MEMRLAALGRRPGGQQAAFGLQLGQRLSRQLRGVTYPDIQIALFGLGNGTAATHQV